MRRRRLLLVLVLLLLALPALAARPRPDLVVLIVVDQLRADHLQRFRPHLLPARQADGRPGGFRYLEDLGASHRQCRYDTLPTFTAVGHAVVSTGGAPHAHGIIGNSWYDRAAGKVVTSVEDDRFPLVGSTDPEAGGAAPSRLDSSTVGDELKLATAGRSRVFSVSLKDRAAILLAGRSADLALWFDSVTGGWVTSRWYRPDGTLPSWVAEANRDGWVAAQFGWVWNKLLPEEAYRDCRPDSQPGAADVTGLGPSFPHPVTGGLQAPGEAFHEALETSPLGTTLTFRMAGEIVRRERLGRGSAPDLLAVNLASYDRAGHAYGPYSPEVLDLAVRADRDLAAFLDLLDREVGLDKVLLALTADHGIAPLPEVAADRRLDGGRDDARKAQEAVQAALEKLLGPGRKYVASFRDPHLYLETASIPAARLEEARVVAREAMLATGGVFDCYTRDQVREGRLPRTEVAEAVSRSFHRERCGDLFVVMKPFRIYAFREPYGTTHGTPWAYDTQVPLMLAGPGIRPGERLAPCSPRDLAPTLCTLLEISSPAVCSGRVLEEDLSGVP